jgi:hypothetical protein
LPRALRAAEQDAAQRDIGDFNARIDFAEIEL